SVRNESDPFPVWRPARILVAPGAFGNALNFPAIRGDRENLAVYGDGGALGGRREMKAFGLVRNAGQRHFVFLHVGLDVDADLRTLAAGDIEFPEPEVVFIDDGFAVRGDAGKEQIAIRVMRHGRWLPAFLGNLPNVVDALHHFRSAELDVLL